MEPENRSLRFHKTSCNTCRYYRIRKQAGFSCCLLLGRTLSATVAYADRARVCDQWKRRPKTWGLVVEDPHWHDPYIPRESIERIRKRLKITV